MNTDSWLSWVSRVLIVLTMFLSPWFDGFFGVERSNVVDDGVDGAEPVDECVVGGGIVIERVDVVGGVVITVKGVTILKTVEPLIDRGTEARKVIWRSCFMC